MTRDELLESLRELAKEERDCESSHSAADEALLAFINDEEVTKAFESIRKWYS